MKATKLLAALVFALVLSSFASAGWVHFPGTSTTKWSTSPNSSPTPATCWARDYRLHTLWVVQKVLVYADTPRYYNYAADAVTVDQAYTGFWVPDATGIVWPRTDLDEACDTDSLRQNIVWMDVEWYMGTNSILWAK